MVFFRQLRTSSRLPCSLSLPAPSEFPWFLTVLTTVIILALAMPAARWVALIVEKKQHTFTVAGSFFVALLSAPLVLGAVNLTIAPLVGTEVPFMPMMATMAIAYAFGEGIGRLACISFGCCYGKPLKQAHPLIARLFRNHCFVFLGGTKKIAYAGDLEGERVIPIQAITALLYVITGSAAILLFLYSFYFSAFILTIAVTQLWRVFSETQRADYRGSGNTSAYQIMSSHRGCIRDCHRYLVCRYLQSCCRA